MLLQPSQQSWISKSNIFSTYYSDWIDDSINSTELNEETLTKYDSFLLINDTSDYKLIENDEDEDDSDKELLESELLSERNQLNLEAKRRSIHTEDMNADMHMGRVVISPGAAPPFHSFNKYIFR